MPDYSTSTEMTQTGLWAFIIGMSVWMLVIALLVHLFFGFCLKKMAEKSGHQESAGLWWIPIANLLIPIRIAGKPGIWLLLMLIPIVNLIVSIIVFMAVAEKLGKENWWGIIAVLFPIIGFTYLAFSDSTPSPSPA